jgi:hypothetical protein
MFALVKIDIECPGAEAVKSVARSEAPYGWRRLAFYHNAPSEGIDLR